MTRRILLAALLAWLAIGDAQAAQCSVSATPVMFGAYPPFSPVPTDSTGTVSVTCQGATQSYTVALSIGGGGAYATRSMLGPGVRMGYQLYSDVARSQVWGDGSGGSTLVAGSMRRGGGTVSHTVYGRIPALQVLIPGTYSDTIIVTLTW